MAEKKDIKSVNYLGDDEVTDKLNPVEWLRHYGNIPGADPRIINTDGDNTSSKIKMTDPFNGQEVEVLWVEGSGGGLLMYYIWHCDSF